MYIKAQGYIWIENSRECRRDLIIIPDRVYNT